MRKTVRGNPDKTIPYRFKPGQSGNPGGRPKKLPISERYAAVAEAGLPDDLRRQMKLRKGATWGDALAISQFRAAIKGRTDAAREIREAVEGKASLRLELAGQDGESAELDPQTAIQKIREFYGLHAEDEPHGSDGAVAAEGPVTPFTPTGSG